MKTIRDRIINSHYGRPRGVTGGLIAAENPHCPSGAPQVACSGRAQPTRRLSAIEVQDAVR